MNWPFGTPSHGHCSEGIFHTYCIIFAPVQMTVQTQHYGNNVAGKPKQTRLNLHHFPSAQGFLLLGCPCWRACPLPRTDALWSTLKRGSGYSEQGSDSPSMQDSQNTYWDSLKVLLEIRMGWHKTGTSGRFNWMDQLQIPQLVHLASKLVEQMFVLRHWMLSGCIFPLPLRSRCQHNGDSQKLADQH